MKVVTLSNVDVSYYLPKGMMNSVKGVLEKPSDGGLASYFLREIKALRNIDVEFSIGQRVGLVGVNGSGKSTLLKCISGALSPSRGSMQIDGRIASVLSLGGGLNVSLTGRNNAVLKYYNAKNPSMSLSEFLVLSKKSCNLGEYFDMPVSTYSAGMKSRLDRAMLSLVEGEIFLFDEWVVLGDQGATDRDMTQNEELISTAKLILLASHSESLLREWTTELIWLHDGKIRDFGPIDKVLKDYQQFVKELNRG